MKGEGKGQEAGREDGSKGRGEVMRRRWGGGEKEEDKNGGYIIQRYHMI